MQANHSHYCEAGASVELGSGFFRADSRPARDLGVLLLRWLAQGTAASQPLTVLDGLAGCGIRGLRYGLEAGATAVWANDADPDRLPLLTKNLAPLRAQGLSLNCTALTIQKLLAQLLLEERRFDLVDLDGFGAATALVPAALEAVRAHYRHAIIECERPEGSDFFLGELAGVEGDEATLHYIQVNGTREGALTRVPLDDITLLRFDERYVNLFGRYAVADDQH